MNDVLTLLNCRPQIGMWISSMAAIIGTIPDFMIQNKDFILMCFQIIAYILSGAVAIVTLYAKYRDLKLKAKHKFRTKNNLK